MKAFYKYIKESSGLWIVVLLLALFSHGTMLLGKSIGIDTEDIITLQDAFYGEWLSMGRQGLVLLKHLLGTSVFNPYFTGVMTLLFLMVTCLLWNYLFYEVSGKKNWTASFVFSGMLTVSPLITEQLYFKLQAMEVTLGFCMMAVSLLFVYYAARVSDVKKRCAYLAVSVVLNLILFSLYQVMVPLFLFGASVCVFLYCFFREEEAASAVLKRMGILYLCTFFGSFVLNQSITAVWFSSGSGYLKGQVRWFTQPFKDCLINIYWHVRAVVLGRGLYYSKLYPAGGLSLAAIVLCMARKKQQMFIRVGVCLSLLLVIASPFYMTVLCAVEPVMRSQMIMPFALAFVAYALVVYLENRKTLVCIFLLLCMAAGYVQLKGTMQLNYTDSVRYESDVRIAEAIMDELNALEDSAHSYPVIFVGKRSAELNNSCVKGDTIGYSFFEWDADVEPRGFYSTRRIVDFMHTLGGNYIQGNAEQVVMAAEYSKDMANWPMKGSIELYDGCIIVKLSD